MKILYDHQAFSLQNTGGITRYFSEIMTRFSKIEGIELAALLGFSGSHRALENDLKQHGSALLWPYPAFKPGLARYALNEALLNTVAWTSGKFDVYHNTLYRFMPGARAHRLVATHHDCIQEKFPELFKDRERIYRAKRRMFLQADLVFCVSETSRRDLEEFYGVGPERTKVVYNGISKLQRTSKGRGEFKRTVDGAFILYVGRRDRYKNFAGLVSAMHMAGINRTHRLVALGGGRLTAGERDLIKKWQLENHVIVIPYASPDLLAECYSAASLFVYPSLYEGFGIPPLEAMQMKCPVLVASNAATSEICGDGAFFFDPYRIDEFSQMLSYSLYDAGARAAMIKRGSRVAERYSWDRAAAEILAGYKAII